MKFLANCSCKFIIYFSKVEYFYCERKKKIKKKYKEKREKQEKKVE